MEEKMVPLDAAQREVRKMADMMAALYRHFSQEIIDAVGEAKGVEIIQNAVWRYGQERGRQHREKVLGQGFPDEPESYTKLPDLPAFGWDVEKLSATNPSHVRVTYCPFAAHWKEKGFQKIGRLYCAVDQAKYSAFHENSDYAHLQNTLDGDDCCEMICRKKVEP
ncbi:hypothetical protein GTO89_15685 [Heliobacterium gestii]|uniref:L-2-amino-thiazoline-4-carboxylic acid hydrolase n=1 Tax=Heliomicrobium gestii TaxID=2699 RepID=A0A845LM79_HELGE|nr:L-2-amino-thiazoline-4-carboxylic acid hydrolase [Heliomicrobium gestii]MBM7868282.1 hypothetical protein [Heliomicrobium gestii]MZP44473.1 hypothetical protein [Heliomicrobium gestii]